MSRIASFFGFSEDNERVLRIATISLVGVLMIRKGLSYPVPVPEEETWGALKEKTTTGFEVVSEPDFDGDSEMV